MEIRSTYSRMELNSKDNITKEKMMDIVFLYGQMDLITKDNLKKISYIWKQNKMHGFCIFKYKDEK